MEKMADKKDVADVRATYVAPRVVKISDLKQGSGQRDCATGSGDTVMCETGNSATGSGCDGNGNNPNPF